MNPKPKKPFYKRWWFITLVVFALLGAIGDLFDGEEPAASDPNPIVDSDVKEKPEEVEPVPEPEPEPEIRTYTAEQIALLERSYTDFSEEEIASFANMIRDWDFLSEEDKTLYEVNYLRLKDEKKAYDDEKARIEKEEREKAEAEAKAQAEAEAKAKWDAFVAENSKTLGAGTFYSPDHIAEGVYDTSFTGSGNFFITGNGGLDYNEIGGGSYGVSKIRVYITDTAEIEIRGMKVNFVPVQRTPLPITGFTLYAGFWQVGDEIPTGRYEVKPGRGESGNFFVFGKNNVNEILGGSYGVESVTINVTDGDIVNIRGMENVTFTPTN